MSQTVDGDTNKPKSGWLRRFALRFLLSAAIGGAFVYLAFRGLNPGELAGAFKKADYLWIIPFVATLVGVQFFRAWRWRFLLQPITEKVPGFWRILTVSSVGFGAIILLPLRLGEFVRPYLISDPKTPDTPPNAKRLRMSAAFGTIAVERAVDGLMVSLFLFVSFLVLSDSPTAPSWMMPTAYTALAVFGTATLFLVAGLARPKTAVKVVLQISLISPLANRFGGRMERLRTRLVDLLDGLISGFAALASAGCLLRFVVTSLIYWIFNGLGYYVLAQAFHLELSLVAAYATCGMVAIGIILPAGPGLVGNFHEFGKFGLQISLPAAVLRAEGMAFIVLIHGLHFIWYVTVGLLATRSKHARFSRVLKATVKN